MAESRPAGEVGGSVIRRAVLFDLDDTLFDHHRSARAALSTVHARFAGSVAFDDFERHHIHYLEEMHIEVLAGRVPLDDARRERFRRVFAALGLAIDEDTTDAVASAYRDGYMIARRATDGAAELLAELRPHARVAIVTNNLLEEQQNKLEYCGLAPLVDALVASEDVGVSKPDPAIFQIALQRLGTPREYALMVGDSWQADIAGATAAGIRAVWFNPQRLPRPQPFYEVDEIHSLTPAREIAARLLAL
jgi:putative hydrolase of the HAD superfamily